MPLGIDEIIKHGITGRRADDYFIDEFLDDQNVIEDVVIKADPDCYRLEMVISSPSRKLIDQVASCLERRPKLYTQILPKKPDYGYAIKKVIFNDPATIIFWTDGSKTVVKCKEGEKFDKMTGFAMCFCKHFLGDKGSNYQKVFKEWIGEDWEEGGNR